MVGIILIAFFIINSYEGIRIYLGKIPYYVSEAFLSAEERKTWCRRQGLARIFWSFFALSLLLYIYVPGKRDIWEIFMVCFIIVGIGLWFLPKRK